MRYISEKVIAEHPLTDENLRFFDNRERVPLPVFDHASYFEHHRNESAILMHRAIDPAKQDSIYEKKKLMREAYNKYLAGELSENVFKDCLAGILKQIESIVYEEHR